MRIFIDSANLDEIRRAIELGATGVTTNPTSMARWVTPVERCELLSKICAATLDDVSVQVVSSNHADMYREGITLSGISHHVVIKVPANEQGLIACRRLSEDRIRVNVTLVFNPIQAILAANAGAYIVSPFLARSDDAYGEGGGYILLSVIREAFDRHKLATKILAASIRNIGHVQEALEAGCDICTMSLSVMESFYQNELTEKGLAKMMSDWNAAQGKLDHAPTCLSAGEYGGCTCGLRHAMDTGTVEEWRKHVDWTTQTR